MTITDSDLTEAQSTVNQFQIQRDGSASLVNSIKNILDDFGDRLGKPSIKLSLREIKDICDFETEMHARLMVVKPRLHNEISQYGVEVQEETHLDLNELDEITEDEEHSYPIVELDPRYYDNIDNYAFQRNQAKKHYSAFLTIMQINHDKVLVYDPFENYLKGKRGIDIEPYEIGKELFEECWSGDHETRPALWVETTEQAELGRFA